MEKWQLERAIMVRDEIYLRDCAISLFHEGDQSFIELVRWYVVSTGHNRGDNNDDYVPKLKPKHEKKSWIYVVKDVNEGFTKIGITEDLQRRLSQLERDRNLRLIAKYRGTRYDEKFLHRHELIRPRKKYGEWFDLGETHYELIKSYFKDGEKVY